MLVVEPDDASNQALEHLGSLAFSAAAHGDLLPPSPVDERCQQLTRRAHDDLSQLRLAEELRRGRAPNGIAGSQQNAGPE
jgi:hypothetical protein